MDKLRKPFLIILIILDIVVLSGQVWPEGAPPFARTVNITFLVLSLVFFLMLLLPFGDTGKRESGADS